MIASYLLVRQPYKYSRKLSDIYLLYAVPVLTLPLIVALASRTGWLASIIAILLVIPYMYRFATKARFRTLGSCNGNRFGFIYCDHADRFS